MIYITSDHGGFELKKEIIKHLMMKDVEVENLGPDELIPEDDYPDYVKPAMKKVLESEENKAILLCRSGSGEVIAANKFKGIRAASSWNKEHAKKSREDNNTNVLALPADYIDVDAAKEIVDTWLDTDFSEAERHKRRIEKIKRIEESNFS